MDTEQANTLKENQVTRVNMRVEKKDLLTTIGTVKYQSHSRTYSKKKKDYCHHLPINYYTNTPLIYKIIIVTIVIVIVTVFITTAVLVVALLFFSCNSSISRDNIYSLLFLASLLAYHRFIGNISHSLHLHFTPSIFLSCLYLVALPNIYPVGWVVDPMQLKNQVFHLQAVLVCWLAV
jgi:hypothetical protein